MKALLKKLIAYDKLYPLLQNSAFYHFFKRTQASVARSLYGNPAEGFFLIGVTWTNGKTTTVNLIHQILNDNLAPAVAVSTANIKIWNKNLNNLKKMTSLDAFDLQALLSTAKNNGCQIAILEASSQGLDQHRFEGVDFDVAVLTNITHDHLDYHGTMENYAESKKKLFKWVLNNKKQNKFWIFPSDDSYGRKWFEEMPFDKKINYALQASAILKATQIIEYIDHTDFTFSYLGKLYRSSTKLLWTYNISNILAAISVGIQIWLSMESILASVERFEGIEWRMQNFTINGVQYFVDFAHTPDGLEKTLTFLHNQKGDWKLITVFGAPGNRDKAKRPIMWEIAGQYSDILIATDDDPSSENRLEILDQLTSQIQTKLFSQGKELFIIPERLYAIKLARDLAKPWDIVLIAGKGHEKVQLTNFGKRERSDQVVVKSFAQNTNQ